MRFLALVVSSLVILGSLAYAGDGAGKEMKALAGKWKLVAMEENGTELPKDKLPAISFVAKGDGSIKVKMMDMEMEATMVLDPGKNPKTINIDHQVGPHKGKQQYGIYKLADNRFTVVASSPGDAEADRPRDFDTKGSACRLMIFERVK